MITNNLVSKAVVWISTLNSDYVDPTEAVNQNIENDESHDLTGSLLKELYDLFENNWFTSKDVSEKAKSLSKKSDVTLFVELLDEISPGIAKKDYSTISIGRMLRSIRDVVANDLELQSTQKGNKSSFFRVNSVVKTEGLQLTIDNCS